MFQVVMWAAISLGAADGGMTPRLCLDARPMGELRAPNLPSKGDFSFRVDAGSWRTVPTGEAVWMDGIQAEPSHRLTIRRGGKAYETLKFSFDSAPALHVRRNAYGFFTFQPLRAEASCPPAR